MERPFLGRHPSITIYLFTSKNLVSVRKELLKNKKQLANHLASHKTITCIGCEKVIPLNSRGHHDRFLEAGGIVKTVRDFKSCMFKPMTLTNGKDDTPVLVQYHPDPLHIVLLGPCNNCLSKLEEKYPQDLSLIHI